MAGWHGMARRPGMSDNRKTDAKARRRRVPAALLHGTALLATTVVFVASAGKLPPYQGA